MPYEPHMKDHCRVCGRPFNKTDVKRCMSHEIHCEICCPGGTKSGDIGKDRGDIPFEYEKRKPPGT